MGNVLVGAGVLPTSCALPSYAMPSEAAAAACGRINAGLGALVLAAVLGLLYYWAAHSDDAEVARMAQRGPLAAAATTAVLAALLVWIGDATARGAFRGAAAYKAAAAEAGVPPDQVFQNTQDYYLRQAQNAAISGAGSSAAMGLITSRAAA